MENPLPDEASRFLTRTLVNVPSTVIVLGSGLSSLAGELENPLVIPYEEIPGFPLSTVEGHLSRMVSGSIGGRPVLAMQGRFHRYEGYGSAELAYPWRVLAGAGCRKIILTNAAGGINPAFRPGDIVLVRDHINFTFCPPVTKVKAFGSGVMYCPELREAALKSAQLCSIPLRTGVYGWTGGPSFETPSEIRMMRILGADMVGMSTVPEAVTAAETGMEVLALSMISNMASGILDQRITMEEVVETARSAGRNLSRLIGEVLKWI